MDLYQPISGFVERIAKDLPQDDEVLCKDIKQLQQIFEKEEKLDSKEILKRLQDCFDQVKETIEEYDKKNWFGKLIKKKKKET